MAWSIPSAAVSGAQIPAATTNAILADLTLIGGAWTTDARATTAIWTTTGGAAIGNGTLVSRYRIVGKTLDWEIILTAGTTTNFGSGQFTFTYPGGFSPLNAGASVLTRYFDSSAPATYMGQAIVNSATVNLQCITSAAGLMAVVNSTAPMAWGTGDVASFLLTGCEVA